MGTGLPGAVLKRTETCVELRIPGFVKQDLQKYNTYMGCGGRQMPILDPDQDQGSLIRNPGFGSPSGLTLNCLYSNLRQ